MVTFILYALILGGFAISFLVEVLNLNSIQTSIPKEFVGIYDEEKYIKSQEYLKANTQFGLVQEGVLTTLLILFIFFHGFAKWDNFLQLKFSSPIIRGLIYIGGLSLLNYFAHLPFSLYETFKIEEKFGFNKTDLKTFIIDQIKSLFLGFILGGFLLGVILWFFQKFNNAWFIAFLFVVGFQIFMMFIAPITIMPFFNKFTPLEDGDLKNDIQNFATAQSFKLSGIFKMDGSKRSTKANAYFTGFGKFRRIVLFDTLITKHSREELVAVLAHEIGHYKMNHIFRQLGVSILETALTFYIFSLFINNHYIFDAFSMEYFSVYASLVFFGIFFSPISSILSLYSLYLSRKYEFEADHYAALTYKKPEALSLALKKLSADSLSNLTPHPLKVFLEYTHPPVLKRIERLKN